MKPDRWKQVRGIVEDALDRSAGEREAFVRAACDGDEELARDVTKMLAFDADDESLWSAAGAIEREGDGADLDALLAEFRRLTSSESPYSYGDEIGRGGMGSILTATDDVIGRTLAIKVERISGGGSDADSRTRHLGRFLDEARIMAQLHHPGIVPVSDLGVDADGRLFFAMRRVEGDDLRAILDRARAGDETWTRTRILDTLVRACDTLAYAHSRGVVHRDIKPANIMVGRFGEAYVMDWGLARLIHQDEEESQTPSPQIDSARERASGESGSSALLSIDGELLGTPVFMAPEQADGRHDDVGPWTDVYAMGAILYDQLAGAAPYVAGGEPRSAIDVVHAVRAGPPAPLTDVAPDAPAELIAICEKAMERHPADRYASMTALADDLRAFLSGRVVRAHATGPITELRKWVARNRAVSSVVSAALVGALIGTVWFVQGLEARRADAEKARLEAEAEAASLLRLSDRATLDRVIANLEHLRPPDPARRSEVVAALAEADRLITGMDAHRAAIADLDRRLLERPGERTIAWWRKTLVELVADLESFATDDPWGQTRASIAKLLADTDRLERVMRESADEWRDAIDAIGDRERHPDYDGLELTPQLGLVPIGADPRSGLWEFWHVLSGARPQRNDDGDLVMTEVSGLVLVLIPGGAFLMGAQSTDPSAPNYDPLADECEGPVHERRVEPFFLSKFELTTGAWRRLTGSSSTTFGTLTTDLTPAHSVIWLEGTRALGRVGLSLPSEAEWEWAARARTTTPWSIGATVEEIMPLIHAEDEGMPTLSSAPSPIHSYPPNPFGLHEVHGNVMEWCQDVFDYWYGNDAKFDRNRRVLRGGGYGESFERTRTTHRGELEQTNTNAGSIGLRPARTIVD